jgi:hypothetical protein
MSFQTSQPDIIFGPSGERILPFSIKGQIFEFQNTIYTIYLESINNQYSVIMYNTDTTQKIILYTSSNKLIIRTLQYDPIHQKIWFGGYIDSPMRGFFASTSIRSINDSVLSFSIQIKEDIKTIETITIINSTTIIYSAISHTNECWIMNNNSNNVYKIDTSLSSISIKDVYLRNKIYHIFIEGISDTYRTQIHMYKIQNNILDGSF